MFAGGCKTHPRALPREPRSRRHAKRCGAGTQAVANGLMHTRLCSSVTLHDGARGVSTPFNGPTPLPFH